MGRSDPHVVRAPFSAQAAQAVTPADLGEPRLGRSGVRELAELLHEAHALAVAAS